jgi:hypothetical protein
MKPHDSITPVTFSREELREIRRMLLEWQENPVCPRCGRHLTVVEPGPGGATGPNMWHVSCPPCRRAAFIAGVQ